MLGEYTDKGEEEELTGPGTSTGTSTRRNSGNGDGDGAGDEYEYEYVSPKSLRPNLNTLTENLQRSPSTIYAALEQLQAYLSRSTTTSPTTTTTTTTTTSGWSIVSEETLSECVDMVLEGISQSVKDLAKCTVEGVVKACRGELALERDLIGFLIRVLFVDGCDGYYGERGGSSKVVELNSDKLAKCVGERLLKKARGKLELGGFLKTWKERLPHQFPVDYELNHIELMRGLAVVTDGDSDDGESYVSYLNERDMVKMKEGERLKILFRVKGGWREEEAGVYLEGGGKAVNQAMGNFGAKEENGIWVLDNSV